MRKTMKGELGLLVKESGIERVSRVYVILH